MCQMKRFLISPVWMCTLPFKFDRMFLVFFSFFLSSFSVQTHTLTRTWRHKSDVYVQTTCFVFHFSRSRYEWVAAVVLSVVYRNLFNNKIRQWRILTRIKLPPKRRTTLMTETQTLLCHSRKRQISGPFFFRQWEFGHRSDRQLCGKAKAIIHRLRTRWSATLFSRHETEYRIHQRWWWVVNDNSNFE